MMMMMMITNKVKSSISSIIKIKSWKHINESSKKKQKKQYLKVYIWTSSVTGAVRGMTDLSLSRCGLIILRIDKARVI